MCDFCHQHGDGKKWYLQAKNYSQDLASDPKVAEVLRSTIKTAVYGAPKFPGQIRAFQKAPRPLRRLVNWYTDRDLRRRHHGQVVPLEDLRLLLSDVVTSVVRLPCICRKGAAGEGAAYCMAVTAAPGTWDETARRFVREEAAKGTFTEPELSGLETLTPQQALDLAERWEEEGLVHTLWTFNSPFIGGLCHCDVKSCAALRFLMGGVNVLAPGEYAARVDPELCNGCKECARRCPFRAMAYDAAQAKARVRENRCYGCGLCRTVCEKAAIALAPRPDGALVLLPWPA
jgi:Pyruvate/2-oxoacid:ferredoxin oxidoreductase delta subunit